MQPTDIQSPGQLLTTALTVEQTATRHYADIATRMRHYGNHETVELFERLAREGRERESRIAEWMELESIEPVEHTDPSTWEDEQVPTTYDAEARDPYRSTPYKALAYAAHNTDRAFNLFTYISANAEDPQTERYARILARDTLNRARLLKSRRRRAYHAEHRGIRQRQLDTALRLKTLSELHTISASIESRLADLLTIMANHYADLTRVAQQSGATMERCRQNLIAAGAPVTPSKARVKTENIGADLHQDMLMLFAECERAFNFYDTVMAHAYDETIMLEAQHLSESSLARLEAIRRLQQNHGIEPAA
jgi:rubrerythrin